MRPLLGTWPTTQEHALSGNQTGDHLVRSQHSIHWATAAREVFNLFIWFQIRDQFGPNIGTRINVYLYLRKYYLPMIRNKHKSSLPRSLPRQYWETCKLSCYLKMGLFFPQNFHKSWSRKTYNFFDSCLLVWNEERWEVSNHKPMKVTYMLRESWEGKGVCSEYYIYEFVWMSSKIIEKSEQTYTPNPRAMFKLFSILSRLRINVTNSYNCQQLWE